MFPGIIFKYKCHNLWDLFTKKKKKKTISNQHLHYLNTGLFVKTISPIFIVFYFNVMFLPLFREFIIAPPTACDSVAWSVRNLVFHR